MKVLYESIVLQGNDEREYSAPNANKATLVRFIVLEILDSGLILSILLSFPG